MKDNPDRKIKALERELVKRDRQIEALKKKLEKSTKEHLSLIEEYQAANEELFASNELLTDTNQELQSAYSKIHKINVDLLKKESDLEVSQANQSALLNNTLQAICLLKRNCIVVAFNKPLAEAVHKAYGIKLKPGMSFLDFINPQDVPWFKREFNRAVRGTQIIGEIEITLKDSKRMFRSYNFTPVKVKNKKIELVSYGSLDITKEKEALNRIKQSEERFRAIFENSPIGITLVDTQNNYLAINKAMCRMMGYSEKELSEKTFLDITHPEDVHKDTKLAEQIFKGEIPFYKMEKRFIHKKGKIVWGNLIATVVKDERGQPLYGIGLVEDITSRKRTEEEIRKLSTVVSQTKNLITITNAKGYIEWVNDAYLETLQFTKRDVLGTKPSFFKRRKQNKTNCDTEILNALEHGLHYSGEIPCNSKEGVVRWFHIDITPIHDQHGHLTHFAIIETDVSDKKAAERKLRESEQWFKNILNATVDAILVEHNEKIHYVNKAFLQLYGYGSSEEVLGEHVTKMFAAEKSDLLIEYGKKRLKGKRVPEVYETTGLKKNNSSFDLEISASVFKVGEEVFIISIIRDITDKKLADAQLKSQNTELRKINAELDRFVYSASHDLRAPLLSILGLTNIAKKEVDPVKNKEIFGMIEKSVKRLDSFIQDIVSYSRNARLEVESEKIDLDLMIGEIFKDLQYIDGAETMELIIKGEKGKHFYSDERRLRIIFNNLISNSIRYFNPKNTKNFIEIQYKIGKKNLKVTLRDNGIGIAKKHIHSIFNMFYRGSNSSSGSGLGLYIVKETIDTLNGSIEVESKLNNGVKFIMEIPNQTSNAK
ncbi:PAS domain S-box protein [Fulvivirgaceae bacterium BMA10]|uniref:histidine kinase n=1 Tax=Splendidivirga corallicola TaxID=3051826 RepID=A0ABT8KRK6_9BACT|nr:PAS domain S-box protein [Fulvivirgaceae bacterium BMA10]